MTDYAGLVERLRKPPHHPVIKDGRDFGNGTFADCRGLGWEEKDVTLDLEAATAIEELQRESEGRRKALLDKATEARDEWFRAERAEAQLALARQGLQDVVNPLEQLRRYADSQDAKLSGEAYHIANNIHYVQEIARNTLSALNPGSETT